MKVRRGVFFGGALALTLGGAVSSLVTFGTSRALASDGDDRAIAEAIVQELEHAATGPAASDEARKKLTADPIQRSRAALERGVRMRAAGDEAHARLTDGLAREWAELARDLVKAADVEKKAGDVRRDALDAGAQMERERALLEEGIARTGRLRAELEAAEREAKETNRTAAAAMDAGAPTRVVPRPRPPAPAPAPAPAPKRGGGGGRGNGSGGGQNRDRGGQ